MISALPGQQSQSPRNVTNPAPPPHPPIFGQGRPLLGVNNSRETMIPVRAAHLALLGRAHPKLTHMKKNSGAWCARLVFGLWAVGPLLPSCMYPNPLFANGPPCGLARRPDGTFQSWVRWVRGGRGLSTTHIFSQCLFISAIQNFDSAQLLLIGDPIYIKIRGNIFCFEMKLNLPNPQRFSDLAFNLLRSLACL